MARTRAQKRTAKARNQTRREALLAPTTAPPRVRSLFIGRQRRGDAAELRLDFTGSDVIQVDPERPVESLSEALAARWWQGGEEHGVN